MTTHISSRIRNFVKRRADNRCEYCQLSQASQEATFHVDHVMPLKAGGLTEEGNLALACVSCSLRKSARQFALDPLNDMDAPIFNPRKDDWNMHFRWNGEILVGLTASGRATVTALNMNRSIIIAIRKEETLRGRHPVR